MNPREGFWEIYDNNGTEYEVNEREHVHCSRVRKHDKRAMLPPDNGGGEEVNPSPLLLTGEVDLK
jgi:hypothetical protein